jgi:hypothetical protein
MHCHKEPQAERRLGLLSCLPQTRLLGQGVGGCSAKPSIIVCNPAANRPCVGHHQKYESEAAVLFVTAQVPR